MQWSPGSYSLYLYILSIHRSSGSWGSVCTKGSCTRLQR